MKEDKRSGEKIKNKTKTEKERKKKERGTEYTRTQRAYASFVSGIEASPAEWLAANCATSRTTGQQEKARESPKVESVLPVYACEKKITLDFLYLPHR